MLEKLENVLEDLGLPLKCCPSCERCDWRFEGSTRFGFSTVSCTWCNRTYTGMSASEEYAHWAGRARDAALGKDIRKVRQAHARMRSIWDSYGDLDRSEWRLVCTYEGRMGDSDDDIPF